MPPKQRALTALPVSLVFLAVGVCLNWQPISSYFWQPEKAQVVAVQTRIGTVRGAPYTKPELVYTFMHADKQYTGRQIVGRNNKLSAGDAIEIFSDPGDPNRNSMNKGIQLADLVDAKSIPLLIGIILFAACVVRLLIPSRN